MRKITFSIYELNMIFEDQKDYLENCHLGKICIAAQSCPPDHFDDEDIEDIFMRQEIMKKILEDAGRT